jgi:ribosomal protein L14
VLQKQTWLFLTDNTNVRWLRLFQLYKGSFRKSTHEGLFIKGSARIVEPPRIEYKGFKYRYKVKGDICRCWIARTRLRQYYIDHRFVQFNDNSGININKKVNIMSKYINGPISRSIQRKKLVTLFNRNI